MQMAPRRGRAFRPAVCAGILVVVVLALLPGASSACACGEFRGAIVAQGNAPSGMPWRIKAGRPTVDSGGRRGVEFYFSVGPLTSYERVGYFIGMELPISKQFVLRANAGSDIFEENDLSGVVHRKAVVLAVGLSTGERLSITPRLAPKAQLRRFPWLRGLRFFDEFFSRESNPIWVRAFDHRGRPLGGARSNRGLFSIVKRGAAPGAPLWDREFVAVSVRGGSEKSPPTIRPRKIHVSFAKSHGRWIGWEVACNSFGARVRITRTKLKIRAVIGTTIGCPPALEREDAWLTRFFQSDPKWRWHASRLTLWSEGNVIKLKREG
jgi:heat shock protein HslJ